VRMSFTSWLSKKGIARSLASLVMAAVDEAEARRLARTL
jgi:hypothetical protein